MHEVPIKSIYLLRMRITGLGLSLIMAADRIMYKVLLLGSGRTCPPLLELLTREGDVSVTVGMFSKVLDINLVGELGGTLKLCSL